jgi:hypothetical protein
MSSFFPTSPAADAASPGVTYTFQEKKQLHSPRMTFNPNQFPYGLRLLLYKMSGFW